jgi:hypothetical protein
MTAPNLGNSSLWAVTIHDKAPQGYLAFDVKDILGCLGHTVDDYLWFIKDIDCTGEMPPTGRLLSTEEILAASATMGQTIDATIVGMPRSEHSPSDLQRLNDLAGVSHTSVPLVIRAVDSTLFEVTTKDYEHVRLINQDFHDVRDEDVDNYL